MAVFRSERFARLVNSMFRGYKLSFRDKRADWQLESLLENRRDDSQKFEACQNLEFEIDAVSTTYHVASPFHSVISVAF
jgi:hypothetical protein